MQEINFRFKRAMVKKPPGVYNYVGRRKFTLEEQNRRKQKRTKELNMYSDTETNTVEKWLRGLARRPVLVFFLNFFPILIETGGGREGGV